MGLFDRDYDREYDRRPMSNDLNYDTWRYRAGERNAGGFNNRNYLNETTRRYSGTNDQGYRMNRGNLGGGYDRGFAGSGYDRGFRGYDRDMRTVGIGYDEEYKPRSQTDYGDPFGDRQSHTPIRMIRGEAHGYDRGFTGGYGRDYNSSTGGYGRDYSSNPVSYDPGYSNTRRGFNNDRGMRGGARGGYDRDWF
jgi:hypothetical protein